MLERIQTASEVDRLVQGWKDAGLTVGFVPTMGALHSGHLSLVKLALEYADRVVVSIFVNPTQFAPHEDFDAYPRDLDGDADKLAKIGSHCVYTPTEADIYPDGHESFVKAGEAAQGLEGEMRPTHFDGVVNVVYRLFEQVKPNVAVFGEKDYQQLQVLKEMVEAQRLPVQIIGAPIARDEHGLALSSRNAYLSADELAIARQLNVILRHTASSLRAQQSNPEPRDENGLPRRSDDLLAMTEEKLRDAGFDKVDYVAERWGRILAAAYVGQTRLIDNIIISDIGLN